MPASTMLTGVVLFLGGVAEVHWLFPRSLLCLVDFSGRKPRFESWSDMMVVSSMSYLCWEHHVWKHGLEFYIPPMTAVVYG